MIRNLCSQRRTKGLAVISTYEGLRKYRASLLTIAWTAVCLDEGQKIRNANADITLICKKLSSFHRVILSGTPIQNNLKELWSLFDFIYPGRLGTLTVFDLEFASPIRVGGYLNATKLQYEIAIRSAFTLQRIVQPYLLRRKKDDLILAINLPAKTEQVLFCRISPKQREIYSSILSSDEVRAVIEKRIAAFRAINTLRKLCNHPFLVYRRGSIMWQDEVHSKLGKTKDRRGSRAIEENDYLSEAGDYNGNDDMSLTALLETEGSGNIRWQDSGKMLVLSKILPLWYKEGHKVLLFSQTRAMLDLMEIMVKEMKFKFLRLDGSTPVSKRSFIIDQFNAKKDIFIMLLTTRTGGVGISLTAANRVVLFDPDWNPMTDIQSRERAWRLGQTREVVIYRLITRGTIEEKIYQRQIFKLLLTNRVLENPKQKALFSKTEIKELFELTDTNKSDPYHMHGSNVTEEDLPLEGQVNLTDPEKARPTAPFYSADINDNELLVDDGLLYNDDAQVDKSADQLPAAEQDAEDLELFSSRELMNDRNFGFEVEDYVDQPMVLNENQDKASLIDNFSIIDMEESNETTKTDRKLLKALFDGEAITSVYNHDYLEPGRKEQKKDSFVTTRFIQEKAARAVEGAYNHLKSSAPMFHSSASYSNDHINSSTHLLAIMRSNQNRSRVESSSSSGRYNNSSDSSHPAASVQHTSSQPSSSTSMAAPSHTRRLSVDEQMRHRLLDLFAKNPRQPLSTVYILQQFKDLGDQYAPLFKEILRSIANRSDGRWLKK